MTDVVDEGRVVPAVEPPTIYLHIGTMKTGTSFLQRVLVRNRKVLAANGVLFPTDASSWGLQVRAARDVLKIVGPRPSDGAWQALLDQVRAHRGTTVLISMEFFSFATAATVKQIVDDLGGERVQVIITARDYARVMPSAWQSMMKQGHPWSFDEFVESVTHAGPAYPEAAMRFWKHHDLVSIVERWLAVVGPDRLHLVTLPPSGAPPELLWERFAGVVGLDPAAYDVSQDQKSNFSLSYTDTEMLRQVSLALGGRLSKLAHKRWVSRWLANRVIRSSTPEADDRPVLDQSAQQWAADTGQHVVEEFRNLNLHVHGDLDDLLSPASTQPVDGLRGPRHLYPERTPIMIAEMLVRLALVDPNMPDGGGEDDDAASDASAQRPVARGAVDDEELDFDLDDLDLIDVQGPR